ncbi:hypothetical protein J6590_064965 [Homalodisca vitripennis]|nr:hypothetical protein J6590_064965 [Homalodisca vitripennis]
MFMTAPAKKSYGRTNGSAVSGGDPRFEESASASSKALHIQQRGSPPRAPPAYACRSCRVMSSERIVSLAGAAHFWAPPRIGRVLVSVEGAASRKGREQSRCSWLESSAWVQGRRLAEDDVLTLSIPDLVSISGPVRCRSCCAVVGSSSSAAATLLEGGGSEDCFDGVSRGAPQPWCGCAAAVPAPPKRGSLNRGCRIRWEMSSLVMMMPCVVTEFLFLALQVKTAQFDFEVCLTLPVMSLLGSPSLVSSQASGSHRAGILHVQGFLHESPKILPKVIVGDTVEDAVVRCVNFSAVTEVVLRVPEAVMVLTKLTMPSQELSEDMINLDPPELLKSLSDIRKDGVGETSSVRLIPLPLPLIQDLLPELLFGAVTLSYLPFPQHLIHLDLQIDREFSSDDCYCLE